MNAPAATLEFSRLPSATKLYVRAALARPKGLKSGATIPRIEARVPRVRPDPAQVAGYRSLCGFVDNGRVPPTLPHILAAPLHLAVLTHPEFPLKLLGAVHVRNHVVQHRPLRPDETLDVRVFVEGHAAVDNGIEFRLETRVHDTKGECIWESTSTNLVRKGGGKKKKPAAPWTPPDFSAFREIARWIAPSDIGRRYGRLAGDLNPIHLYPLTAKLFGFPRAIAHGMWSFARSAAEITQTLPVGALTIEAAFKRPVLLPSACVLLVRGNGAGQEYSLVSPDRQTVYLSGNVKAG
jgi:acyl dehydratase